jgi:hypothetical protein
MPHGFVVDCFDAHACLLARIRLTRMAAERGHILSGACGQGERVPSPGGPSVFPRATEGAVDDSTHFNGENGDSGERHLFN